MNNTLFLDHLDKSFLPDGARATQPERAKKGGGVPSFETWFEEGRFGKALKLKNRKIGNNALEVATKLGTNVHIFNERWADYQDAVEPSRGASLAYPEQDLHRLVKECHEQGKHPALC